MGVALAALRESNEIWDTGMFTITVGVLLTSVLLAVHRSEGRRAFWVGFAMFGAVYLGLSVIPSIGSRLITTKALVYLDSKVHRSGPNVGGPAYADIDVLEMVDSGFTNQALTHKLYVTKGNGTFQDVTGSVGLNSLGDQVLFNQTWRLLLPGTREHFMHIGQSVFALLTALVGGQISRRLYAKNRPASQAITSNGASAE
jgi:hypothetical protein